MVEKENEDKVRAGERQAAGVVGVEREEQRWWLGREEKEEKRKEELERGCQVELH